VKARKLRSSLVGAALLLAALPTGAQAAPPVSDVTVCNEAENSHRGGYVVTDGPVDPVPPAFLRGSQMRVGNGHGAGLANAAFQSPALRACGPAEVLPPTDGDGGDTGGGDTGGGDTGGGDTGGGDDGFPGGDDGGIT
jgi:hypothetical protein